MNIQSIGWGFGGCNMHCEPCYNASVLQTKTCARKTLEAVADKICPRIRDINYGTGEFSFNENAPALAYYIKEKYPQVRQALTSNGTTVILTTPEDLPKLFHDIDISLDFPNPEEHNRFRGHPEAWNWVVRSLEKMKAIGMERSLVTCVTSETTDDHIEQLLELATKFGASWRTNWFRQTGRGKEHLRLTAPRFWQIIKLLAQKGVTFECLSDPLLAALLGHHEKNPLVGRCACGTLSCRIQTDLSVTPCVFLGGKSWSGGNIAESDLNQIYDSATFRAVRERQPKFCESCAYNAACHGGCASRAFLHNGSLDAPDDFCPFFPSADKSAVNEMLEEISSIMKVSRDCGKVHDGYLCTMIVKP